MTLFRNGFRDAVGKGTGTGAAVPVVVLCPAFLRRKRGVCGVNCEVAVRRSCSETDAVEVF